MPSEARRAWLQHLRELDEREEHGEDVRGMYDAVPFVPEDPDPWPGSTAYPGPRSTERIPGSTEA